MSIKKSNLYMHLKENAKLKKDNEDLKVSLLQPI
jgi:hypothetical protein